MLRHNICFVGLYPREFPAEFIYLIFRVFLITDPQARWRIGSINSSTSL